MIGWLKLHRTITEWEWYSDANTFRVFMHLLLTANHEPSKFRGEIVPVGATVTGREILAERLKMSVQNVRTALARLESTSEITIKSTNRFSIITLVNWAEYQQPEKNQPAEKPAKQLRNNGEITTLKEGKKDLSKDKSIDRPAEVSEQAWNDWIIARKRKRSGPPTQTTINGIIREAEGVGWSLAQAIEKCAERGWITFQGDYVRQNGKPDQRTKLFDEANQLLESIRAGRDR